MARQKKNVVYLNHFVGPKTEGFNIPCIPLDNNNVLRFTLLIVAPDGTTLEDAQKCILAGPAVMKEKGIITKVRIQRWFRGTEPNSNDPDGLIPSVPSSNGNVVDLPAYRLDDFLAFIQAFHKDAVVKAAAEATQVLMKEAQERKQVKQSLTTCPHCNKPVIAGMPKCGWCGKELLNDNNTNDTNDTDEKKTSKTSKKTTSKKTSTKTTSTTTDEPVDLEDLDLDSVLARLLKTLKK